MCSAPGPPAPHPQPPRVPGPAPSSHGQVSPQESGGRSVSCGRCASGQACSLSSSPFCILCSRSTTTPQSVSLDLSVYVGDLGKTFAVALKSKDDAVREDALGASLALGRCVPPPPPPVSLLPPPCRQCSDPSAVEGLLTELFRVLGGGEGKIGLPAHKAELLQVCQISMHYLEQIELVL